MGRLGVGMAPVGEMRRKPDELPREEHQFLEPFVGHVVRPQWVRMPPQSVQSERVAIIEAMGVLVLVEGMEPCQSALIAAAWSSIPCCGGPASRTWVPCRRRKARRSRHPRRSRQIGGCRGCSERDRC